MVRHMIGAAVCALLAAWISTAHAQVTLSPTGADAPGMTLLLGLVEPIVDADREAAEAYLDAHAAADADRAELGERFATVYDTVQRQSGVRIEDHLETGDGDLVVALTSDSGFRYFVGIATNDARDRITALRMSPGWQPGPPPPEPAIAGLVDVPESPAVVAFVDVTVVPMDDERVLRDHTVIVRDGRIAWIGPSRAARVPRGAHIVDGAGKYLMPGLAEMHAHLPMPQQGEGAMQRTLFLFAAHGVTTVRGMQGHPAHLDIRDKAQRGELFAPRVITSGPPLSAQTLPTADAATEQVAAQRAAGYDFLKIPYGAGAATFDAIAGAARAEGIAFAGHVWADVGLDATLASGQATIDHLDAYLEALAGHGAGYSHDDAGFFGLAMLDQIDASRMRALAEATRDAGVWNVPTLSWIEHTMAVDATPERLAERPEMRYMPRGTLDWWTAFTMERRADPAATPERRARYISLRRDMVRALHEAGAGLLLGSDSPQMWNVPGVGVRHELEMLVASGLSPYEALATGTRDVAAFIDTDAWGVIARGRAADLLLLDADPLEDVSNVGRVAGVMLRGMWLPADEIERRLALVEAAVGGDA